MQANGIVLDPKSETVILSGSGELVPLATFDNIIKVNTSSDSCLEKDPCELWSLNKIRVDINNQKDDCAKKGEAHCYEMLKSFPEFIAEIPFSHPEGNGSI